MSRKPPAATPEQVKAYFLQYRGHKLEPLDDHLNGNEGIKLQFKQEMIAKAKKNDIGPDGLPTDRKRQVNINFTPSLSIE